MKHIALQTWTPRPRPGQIIAHAKDQQNSKDYGQFPGIDAGTGVGVGGCPPVAVCESTMPIIAVTDFSSAVWHPEENPYYSLAANAGSPSSLQSTLYLSSTNDLYAGGIGYYDHAELGPPIDVVFSFSWMHLGVAGDSGGFSCSFDVGVSLGCWNHASSAPTKGWQLVGAVAVSKTWTAGGKYWCHIRYDGSYAYASIWDDGASEPAWQATAIRGSVVPTRLYFGVGANLVSPAGSGDGQDIVSVNDIQVSAYNTTPYSVSGATVGPAAFSLSGGDYIPPTPSSSIGDVFFDGIKAEPNLHYTLYASKITPLTTLLTGTKVEGTYIAE